MTNRDNDIRNGERARENYPSLVLLETCPDCGAASGAWCKRNVTGKRPKVLRTPHAVRVEQARLGKTLTP